MPGQGRLHGLDVQQPLAHRQRDQPVKLGVGFGLGDFDEHPGHGAEPQRSARAHLLRRRRLACPMDDEPLPSRGIPADDRHLDRADVDSPQPVHRRRRPMTEKRPGSTRQNGSNEVAKRRDAAVAQRPDLLMEPVQDAGPLAALDLAVGDPAFVKLLSADHPLLLSRLLTWLNPATVSVVRFSQVTIAPG